jgi:hypothetical protein
MLLHFASFWVSEPIRNAYYQDGILFQTTTTQQRKLDQPFFQSISCPSIEGKRCNETRCQTDLSGNCAN